MSRILAGFWLASSLFLTAIAGCTEEGALSPATPDGNAPSGTTPAQASLSIKDLKVSQATLVGAEYLDVEVTVERPGTQTLTSYGLRTPYGEKTFPFKPALTVIPDGKIQLQRIGPPVVSKTGPMAVDFWVVDSAGAQSNTLSFEVTVQ